MRVSWSGHVPSDWPVISRRLTGEELDQAIKDIGKAHAEDAPLPARNALLNALMYPDWDPDDGLTQDRADQLIDAAIAEDAEQHAVIADVPDDGEPTAAPACCDACARSPRQQAAHARLAAQPAPGRAQASEVCTCIHPPEVDAGRTLHASYCHLAPDPAAQYTATRGEPGEGQ